MATVTSNMHFAEPTDYDAHPRAEIDYQADTVCAGSAFQLLEATDQETDVAGFHDSLGSMMRVLIGTSATAYDHPGLQETIILVFPQSPYFTLEVLWSTP